jgi:hypothetical protein
MKENTSYVYIYLNPLKPGNYEYKNYKFEYEPFYVGEGTNDRCYKHLSETIKTPNKHKFYTIQKIKTLELKPIIEIITSNLSEKDAQYLEIMLIKIIGRRDLKTGPLTNLTVGGEGVKGCIRSKEWIEKLSERNRNRIWTKESKLKMSKSTIGENNGMHNKSHSEKAKAKIGKENSGENSGIKKLVKNNPEILKGENNHNSKTYKIITPDENVIIIKGLRKFCRENNLHHTNMLKVANKKQDNHKGYKCELIIDNI